MDPGANRRASGAGAEPERRDIQGATEPRPQVPPAAHSRRARCEILHFRIAVVPAEKKGAGTHDAAGGDQSRSGRGAFPGGHRGVGSGGPRLDAGAAGEPLREAPAHGRPDDRGMDAIPCDSCESPRAADSGAHRNWAMSRKRNKDKVTIRVPNPEAPIRERLKTPSHKVHRSKKGYRRREKHQKSPDLD